MLQIISRAIRQEALNWAETFRLSRFFFHFHWWLVTSQAFHHLCNCKISLDLVTNDQNVNAANRSQERSKKFQTDKFGTSEHGFNWFFLLLFLGHAFGANILSMYPRLFLQPPIKKHSFASWVRFMSHTKYLKFRTSTSSWSLSTKTFHLIPSNYRRRWTEVNWLIMKMCLILFTFLSHKSSRYFQLRSNLRHKRTNHLELKVNVFFQLNSCSRKMELNDRSIEHWTFLL